METTSDNTSQGILSTDDQIKDVETENEAPKKRPSELAVEEGKVSIKKQELEAVEPKAASSEEPASATQDAGGSSGETKKRESSSRDVNDSDDKPFGGRILTDESLVFDQNAW
jgi:tRNAThr (cytosine32-N3)-methyltransferase